jgi:hypothetical protein
MRPDAPGGRQNAAAKKRFTTVLLLLVKLWRADCSFFCSEIKPEKHAVTVDFSRNLSNYSYYFPEGGVVNESTDQLETLHHHHRSS